MSPRLTLSPGKIGAVWSEVWCLLREQHRPIGFSHEGNVSDRQHVNLRECLCSWIMGKGSNLRNKVKD